MFKPGDRIKYFRQKHPHGVFRGEFIRQTGRRSYVKIPEKDGSFRVFWTLTELIEKDTGLDPTPHVSLNHAGFKA